MKLFSGLGLRIGAGTVALLCCGCVTSFDSFEPASGNRCQTEVRISGSMARCGRYHVEFNGVRSRDVRLMDAAAPTPDIVTAVVPPGATSGPITAIHDAAPWCIVIGVVGDRRTFPTNFTVVGGPIPSRIIDFDASATQIDRGDPVTVSWRVEPAVSSLTLNGVNVPIPAGMLTFAPTSDTRYVLVTDEGCDQSEILVRVNQEPIVRGRCQYQLAGQASLKDRDETVCGELPVGDLPPVGTKFTGAFCNPALGGADCPEPPACATCLCSTGELSREVACVETLPVTPLCTTGGPISNDQMCLH